MSGFFGVVSKKDCVLDVFYGVDYHSHLGTKRAGLVIYGENGFQRAIHNISNAPFRTKFTSDVEEMKGNMGIGCISDNEPQPLMMRSHLGNFAITTVGRINNMDELVERAFSDGRTQFLEMSGGVVNATELVAALINSRSSIVDGIQYAQSVIEGSMSILLLTPEGLYAARDRLGRTPVVLGKKKGAHCASFESFAYLNLGYTDLRELGPGEVAFLTADSEKTLVAPQEKMKICTFLWAYYGYPSSCYEGQNVEKVRYRCGAYLADRDEIEIDSVAGVPDSGMAHAIGYATRSGVPFSRPFVKYTPTWPRSFMPPKQAQRSLVAHMKLIPIETLIRDKRLLLIDDSIVRGTQLKETTQYLYNGGAKEVHIRLGCSPILFSCKYLNFSRSTSPMDLIARRMIAKLEGTEDVSNERLKTYADPDTKEYAAMLEEIRKEMNFTSLKYLRLDDLVRATGMGADCLCTYCWNGEE